jgi:hypothetical protein
LAQSRKGGYDLLAPDGDDPASVALGKFAIEVKRHAKATPALIRTWWAQAERQAHEAGKVPVLAYRGEGRIGG